MQSLFTVIAEHLYNVEKPGRYTGGEFGCTVKDPVSDRLSVALSFPDLYEIGMSNLALKYLYSYLNDSDNIRCERVFAPALDMENILVGENIPLFTLENHLPVGGYDILAFTVGYELSATNILNIIKLSGIPLDKNERTEDHPLVIAGGPAVTNPHPFSSFFDIVFIGEAEEEFIGLLNTAALLKTEKVLGRAELFNILRKHKSSWYEGRETPAVRAVWKDFPDKKNLNFLPVPNIQAVQDVGTVEIMRGCPNGCRFCHAGIFYRPYREREIKNIYNEVWNIFRNGGYREITLSSLSTGDFSRLMPLVNELNNIYSPHHVSFSLPSLKINSFTLDILGGLSAVRKSGLTFAVEAPQPEWQKSLNKEVSKEKIIEILLQAKKLGWKSAKFYFMIGLPHNNDDEEIDSIASFLKDIYEKTKIHININIGTFIPKPHTPYQWAAQLTEYKALEKIMTLKKILSAPHFKFGYHAPFTSFIESVIARGDRRAGEIILQVYNEGARLDAWEEYLDRDRWRSVIEKQDWDVEKEICSAKDINDQLPWDDVKLGTGKKFLKEEYIKSEKSELMDPCSPYCPQNCGCCGNLKPYINIDKIPPIHYSIDFSFKITEKDFRYTFRFSKKGKARFLSHKNIMSVFERSFQRAGLKMKFSSGFNPKPKMEFAAPLGLGLESECEYVSVDLFHDEDPSDFPAIINRKLPEGFCIISGEKTEWQGTRIPSLSLRLAETHYLVRTGKLVSLKEKLTNFTSDDAIEVSNQNENDFTIKLKGEKSVSSIAKVLAGICGEDPREIVKLDITRKDIIFKER